VEVFGRLDEKVKTCAIFYGLLWYWKTFSCGFYKLYISRIYYFGFLIEISFTNRSFQITIYSYFENLTESLLNLHYLTHIIQKMLTESYMTYYLSKNGNIALKQVTVRSFVTYYEDLLLYYMLKYGNRE
jgi:hypothetical protein